MRQSQEPLKGVIRLKGFVRTLESPLPMGINWTKSCLSRKPINKPVDSFLTFIGHRDFLLPPIPLPEKDLEAKRMIPLGEYEGYLKGRMMDEVSLIEWLLDAGLNYSLVITTKESFECLSLRVDKKEKAKALKELF
ncbi:MAG: hypothetical protein ACK4LA_01535 [Aquificaceae bacterium]